jgi:endonuclease/exonuclease/phosphatase family metal-dependent hydrolase
MAHTIPDPSNVAEVTARIQPLMPYFPELGRLRSHRELDVSPAYRRLRPEIDALLDAPVVGGGGAADGAGPVRSVRAVAWNIERGICLEGIIAAFRARPELASGELLLLSEVDFGMARTRNRIVMEELAAALGMHYAFASCYLALNKGNGIEKRAAGENRESLHGNAILSKYPLLRVHGLALPNGKDKMKGAEKRIGSQRAVIADVAHPAGTFRAVALHLDAHSSQRHRHLQMTLLLDHLQGLTPELPTLIGGDWNTTTHDASRALFSILGYVRRVFMGVRRVVRIHYPHPDRWFERRLFKELESRGYGYRNLNLPGACTLHYTIDDLSANLNMADWVPGWCFHFIRWALSLTGGRCSLKLDWFAGKGIRAAGRGPGVLHDIRDGGKPVSDHDPITLEFEPRT